MQRRDDPGNLNHAGEHHAPTLRPEPGEAVQRPISTEAAWAMAAIDRFLPRTRIAYLSMEIAWEPSVPTYAGGLGVLAGDTGRSCAQLDLPVVFVTLISREGYLSQSILPDGRQADHPEPWEPENWAIALDAMIAVRIEGRTVWVRPWLRVLEEQDGAVPIILLDTRLETNAQEDRTITDRLYGGDQRQRLRQEAVLGLGGERVLHALGFAIETWHLNEGHAALAALARLKRRPRPAGLPDTPGLRFDIDGVRAQCVFTTHTPVEAGHDRFDYETVAKILGDVFPLDQLRLLGGADMLNMTRLALTLSGWVNGVARRHGETTRQMFPGHRIHDITNGIHVPTWAHPAVARLFDEVAPEWRHDPETLANADRIADEALGAAHATAKAELLVEIEQRSGVRIDPRVPLIAYARRMTGYKRPELIFADIERLRGIARRWPFALVFAGKAHPRDAGGQTDIESLNASIRTIADQIPAAFLAGYDMRLAATMVAGADIWLNTPLPPLEASGTSGMKAAVNGGLNLSVLDGWWIEGCIEGVTGWAIGEPGDPERHAKTLYAKLEKEVLPLFYENRPQWTWMMREAISKIGARFNSQRMMRRYASEAYLR